MGLADGRFRTFSKLGASIDVTLADQEVDGTLTFRAPFTEMNGGFHLPADPLAGGALNLRLDRRQTGPGRGAPGRADEAGGGRVAAARRSAAGRMGE